MNREYRIQELAKLIPTEEKKMIRYSGINELLPVYNVPLELLVYNQYNGRIKAMALSWEKVQEPLNAENPEHINIIEQFLWDSAPSRNEQTYNSISSYGQMEVGMISQDGVVIDGNRRVSIIKRINIENKGIKEPLKFKTVILPTVSFKSESTIENRREIVQLETIYQMGVDAKVDYNPIEKYLRCKELRDLGFSINEMSYMLSISIGQISKMLDIYELMSKYLNRYGYEGVYIALEKREGHLVDLRGYQISYERGVGREKALWDYTITDLESMSNVYFDYTRMRFPVQNCRLISNPSKSQSIFCHQDLWREFLLEHEEILKGAIEPEFRLFEESIEDRKIQNVIAERDELWSRLVKPKMVESIEIYKRRLEDIVKKDVPLRKLLSINNTLNSIERVEVLGKRSQDIDDVCNEIVTGITSIKEANSK